jgi:hypothetical protein
LLGLMPPVAAAVPNMLATATALAGYAMRTRPSPTTQ